jgi:hypothetical protein
MRKVKGILNKLTPEKFDRLVGQLIPLVNNYPVLQVWWSKMLPFSHALGSL